MTDSTTDNDPPDDAVGLGIPSAQGDGDPGPGRPTEIEEAPDVDDEDDGA